RDVKPANVWLEFASGRDGDMPQTGGRVKVLDFGLARALEGHNNLTREGVFLGTPAYVAPEQAMGAAEPRSDLFSLGCLLYEVCTGVRPFQGLDSVATLAAVMSRDPVPPHQRNAALPARLSDLIVRLLDKDPAKRPASAQEVAAELATL